MATPEDDLGIIQLEQPDEQKFKDSLGIVDIPEPNSEVQNRSVFVEESNQVVDYSGNMDDDEIEYDVRKNQYSEVEDGFFGAVRIGVDLAENFAKGAGSFAVEGVPRAAVGLASEQAQEPYRLDVTDFVGAVLGNPLDQKELMDAISSANRKRNDAIADQIQASYTRLDNSVKEWATGAGLKPDEGTPNKVAFDVGSGTASLLTSLALAYFSKGKSISGQAKAALFFGGLQKGQSFTSAQEQGKSFQEAQAISSAKGLAEGALEFSGLEIWTKYLRGSKSIQRVLFRGADEFVQEFSQELAGETIDKLTNLSQKDWTDIFAQAGYAGLLGLAIGLPIAGIQTGIENKGWVGKMRKSGFNDAEIEKVGELMQQKATQDSLPEVKKTLDQEARKFESTEIIPEEIRLEISDALQEVDQVNDAQEPEVETDQQQRAAASDEQVLLNTLQNISSTERGFVANEGRIAGEAEGVMVPGSSDVMQNPDLQWAIPLGWNRAAKRKADTKIIEAAVAGKKLTKQQQDRLNKIKEAFQAEIEFQRQEQAVVDEEIGPADETEAALESIPEEVKQELGRISETPEYQAFASRMIELENEIQNIETNLAEQEAADDDTPGVAPVTLAEAIQLREQNKKNQEELDAMVSELERQNPVIQKAVENITKALPKTVTVTQKAMLKRLFLGAQMARRQGFREGRAAGENKSAKAILLRRRARIRAIRDLYGMTDQQLRSISKRDIRLMSDFEFKKFIQDIDARAAEMATKRQIKNEILFQIHEKQLDKDNTFNFIRTEMGTSSIDSMTVDQLNQVNQMLEKYQEGDVFLSTRILETIDNTELAGVRTYREAKEKIAQKLGVDPTKLDGIMPDLSDYVSWDTVLAEKNAFYKYMVEQMAKSEMEALHEFLGQEEEIDRLFEKARASRKKTVGDVIVPTDDLIFEWLDSPSQESFDPDLHKGKRTKEEIAKEMTKPEMDAANYVQARFAQMRDWLVQHDVLEKYQDDYVSHIRRGFLETWKAEGPMSAVKNMFKAYEEDQLSFSAIDPNTGKILPMESFFKFAIRRTGKIEPSKNAGKAYKTYLKAFLKKQRFDKTVPAIELYAMMLEKQNLSEEGKKIHLGLREFVHSYINNKKGRRFSYGGIMRQGGKVDTSIRMLDSFVALLDLGLNVPVSAAVAVGEQAVTVTQLGSGNYAKGVARLSSEKGRKIVEDNREFVGKSPWKDLGDVASNLGDRFKSGLFIAFDSASVEANKIFLLGSLNDAEWESGKVSSQRLAEMRTEMGRWRAVRDSKSILGSTSPATFITKYKSWALPIVRTVLSDLNFLGKKINTKEFRQAIKNGDIELAGKILNQATKTREFQELFRASLLSAIMVAAGKSLVDEDDDSMLGQILKKAYRESLSLIGALDLNMLTASRLGAFIADLSDALMKIVTLEEYKTKEGYRGVEKLKRVLTPTAVKSLERSLKDSGGSKL